MAKIELHRLLEEFTGRIDGLVFRRSHNGKISVYGSPDMSRVEWSPAQVAHRERIAESSAYAKAAMADPGLRAFYEQMSMERKGNKRPYDMAVSDYYHGNNRLGDRFRWNAEHWRTNQQRKRRKRR